jgi:predicted ATP-dependent serine protease
VSGEETLTQIATRAQRLSAILSQLYLLAETNLKMLAGQIMMQQSSNHNPYYSPVVDDNGMTMSTEHQHQTNFHPH